MLLRPYQRAAIDAAYDWLRQRDDAPLLVLPTGAGKTPVLATISREAVETWGGRVLILAHVKELLEQTHGTLCRLWETPLGKPPVGLYSAGLGKRDTTDAVIVAGIQSVHRRGCELGRFDLVLIDEAHLVPRDGEGMYLTLLRDLRVINPHVRLIGLTATPYRLGEGLLHGGEGALFGGVAFEAPVRQLIDEGWLSPLRGKHLQNADLSGVHKRGGEFVADELEAVMDDAERVAAAADEIVRLGADRRAWLVFCCGVKHAGHVAAALAERGVDSPVITGDTPADERADVIRRYKAGALRCIVNVNVLTTGFDAPHVDLVALLRPTCSPGLYYQMVGRGLRKAPGKTDCLVLDFGGNVARHGPVDAIRPPNPKGKADGEGGEAPTKACPQCQEIVPAVARVCNACGYEFPRPEARHEAKAAVTSPLVEYREEVVEVTGIDCLVHEKKGAPPTHPKTLRVIFEYGYRQDVSEWICVEHQGFARSKAEGWWQQHTGQPGVAAPAKAVEARDRVLELLRAGTFRVPTHLTLRMGGKYPELIGREWRSAETGPAKQERDILDLAAEGAAAVHLICPACEVAVIGTECADCGWQAPGAEAPRPATVPWSADEEPPF